MGKQSETDSQIKRRPNWPTWSLILPTVTVTVVLQRRSVYFRGLMNQGYTMQKKDMKSKTKGGKK